MQEDQSLKASSDAFSERIRAVLADQQTYGTTGRQACTAAAHLTRGRRT